MQITQFLVGVVYATAHSFVSYSVPVTVPETRNSAAGTGISAMLAPSQENLVDKLKQLVFNMAGTISSAAAASPSATAEDTTETTYKTIYEHRACITSSGATFAVWLNIIYLLPLTYLFMSFFVKSYLRKSKSRTGAKKPSAGVRRLSVSDVREAADVAEKAGWEAARQVESEIYEQGGAQPDEAAVTGSDSRNGSVRSKRKTRRG